MERRVRDKRDSLRRRAADRDAKLRILIVTEGKETEPNYLGNLQHTFKNHGVHIQIQPQGAAPRTLVDVAIRLRDEAEKAATSQADSNLRYDETWIVCDVDEHPGLKQAVQTATRANIRIALSDPCFELWYLLHREKTETRWHRHKLQSHVRKLIGYNGKLCPFGRLHSPADYNAAVVRSRQLLAISEATQQRNPSTVVHELTERIRTGAAPVVEKKRK